MAKNDIKVQEVPIDLDRQRVLRYDLNAFSDLEDLGMGTSAEVFDLLQNGSIKALRALLWAGLIHEDPDLTLQQVGRWLGMKGITDIAEVIRKAVNEAMPDMEGEVGELGELLGIGAGCTTQEQ